MWVVGVVEHVEVRADLAPAVLPRLVDADVERVKERKPRPIRGIRGDWQVRPQVLVVEAVLAGRVHVTARQSVAHAKLPTSSDAIAPQHREDVRLVELEELQRGSGR